MGTGPVQVRELRRRPGDHLHQEPRLRLGPGQRDPRRGRASGPPGLPDPARERRARRCARQRRGGHREQRLAQRRRVAARGRVDHHHGHAGARASRTRCSSTTRAACSPTSSSARRSSAGIDITSAVQAVYRGEYQRAWSVLGPTTPNAYDPTVEGTWEYDEALANQLLDQAGWTERDCGRLPHQGRRAAVGRMALVLRAARGPQEPHRRVPGRPQEDRLRAQARRRSMAAPTSTASSPVTTTSPTGASSGPRATSSGCTCSRSTRPSRTRRT